MIGPLQYVIAAGGLAAGLAMGWAYDRYIDDPALIKTVKAGCQYEAESAASRARLEQWRRNQAVIDQLNADFARQTRQRAAEQAQIDREIDDDIIAFETAGRSQCSVTVDNIEWLLPRQSTVAPR